MRMPIAISIQRTSCATFTEWPNTYPSQTSAAPSMKATIELISSNRPNGYFDAPMAK